MYAARKDSRLVHPAVTEDAGRDGVEDVRQRGGLLLNRHGVVCVLVPQILNVGSQVPEEDCIIRRRSIIQHIRAQQSMLSDDVYSQTLSSPTSSAISMFAPSVLRSAIRHAYTSLTGGEENNAPTVPTSSPPLRQNFMLDVPDASVPAVEMCWLMSDAGMSTSASETE